MLLCIRLNTGGICHFNSSLEAVGMSRRPWTMGSVSQGSRSAVTCWRVYKIIETYWMGLEFGFRFVLKEKCGVWFFFLRLWEAGWKGRYYKNKFQLSEDDEGYDDFRKKVVSSCVHSNVEGFEKHLAGSLFNKNILLLQCFRKAGNFWWIVWETCRNA